MGMLFCTNKNDFTHEDSYDGKRFVFEPGVRVPLAVEAAEHMFGFRQPDKTSTLHRLGWSMRYDASTKTFRDDPDALAKLSKFIFTEAVMTEAPLAMPPPEVTQRSTLSLKAAKSE
jgi:hypothetical protein